MIPKKLHQIWFGNPPHDAWAKKLRMFNKDIEYRLWREDSMRELGLDLCALDGHLGNWASVSNYVRLVILSKIGGLYLDCDFECHGPLESLFSAGSAIAARQPDSRICNAMLGTEPNHPWISWQLSHWDDFDQSDAASGVYLATAAPQDLVTLIPTDVVYPWAHDDPPEKRHPKANSLLSHHWAGSWVKK